MQVIEKWPLLARLQLAPRKLSLQFPKKQGDSALRRVRNLALAEAELERAIRQREPDACATGFGPHFFSQRQVHAMKAPADGYCRIPGFSDHSLASQACAASNDQSAGPCWGIVPGRSKRCSGIPGISDITGHRLRGCEDLCRFPDPATHHQAELHAGISPANAYPRRPACRVRDGRRVLRLDR